MFTFFSTHDLWSLWLRIESPFLVLVHMYPKTSVHSQSVNAGPACSSQHLLQEVRPCGSPENFLLEFLVHMYDHISEI